MKDLLEKGLIIKCKPMIPLCKGVNFLKAGMQILFVLSVILLINIINAITSDAQEFDMYLRWAANSEPDLAGYIIYWRTDSSGDEKQEYDGVHPKNRKYNSPIELDLKHLDDENNPTYVIPGMAEDKDYFIRLSAYDNEAPSWESKLSKEYTTNEDYDGGGSGDSGGGGGGGGGGCFLKVFK